MTDVDMLKGFLAGAAVFALRPDYRAMLLAVDGLVPGPSDQDSDALLQAAETSSRHARAAGGPAAARGGLAGGPTGRSAPSRNAPATAWRHCCAARNRGCPG
jgi:hypothetical protein